MRNAVKFGKDLQIIKVSIDPKINRTEFINFYYPEQSEFEFRLSSMYDAEGLISIDDYLLIFTKNRANKISDIYKEAIQFFEIEKDSEHTPLDTNEEKNDLDLVETNQYYLKFTTLLRFSLVLH